MYKISTPSIGYLFLSLSHKSMWYVYGGTYFRLITGFSKVDVCLKNIFRITIIKHNGCFLNHHILGHILRLALMFSKCDINVYALSFYIIQKFGFVQRVKNCVKTEVNTYPPYYFYAHSCRCKENTLFRGPARFWTNAIFIFSIIRVILFYV